ncbi:MAG: type II secretion system protein [Elusimicrobiota bacterium]
MNILKKIISNKGFTYIEIIVAMVILSYVILAFTRVFMGGVLTAKNMEFKTVAYNYAIDEVEHVRNLAYNDVTNFTEQRVLSTGKKFTITRIITVIEADILKQVDVVVSWKEGGDTKTTSMTTLVAQY